MRRAGGEISRSSPRRAPAGSPINPPVRSLLGWDRLFVPDEYDDTLAQLTAAGELVDFRRDRVRGRRARRCRNGAVRRSRDPAAARPRRHLQVEGAAQERSARRRLTASSTRSGPARATAVPRRSRPAIRVAVWIGHAIVGAAPRRQADRHRSGVVDRALRRGQAAGPARRRARRAAGARRRDGHPRSPRSPRPADDREAARRPRSTSSPLGNGPRLRARRTSSSSTGGRRTTSATSKITLVPARHWSMRMPWNRNATLWGGYVIESPEGVAYHSGDTALCDRFAEIGAKFPHRLGDAADRRLLAALVHGAAAHQPRRGRRRLRRARREELPRDALGHVQAHRRAARRAAPAHPRGLARARLGSRRACG